MGRGGYESLPPTPSPSCPPSSSTYTTSSTSTTSSPPPSALIRLQYPKSSRLLLGTTANLQQSGFLKALETHYPLELSLSCTALSSPSMFRKPHRLRPFCLFFYRTSDPSADWELIGRTETVVNCDTVGFVTKLKVCCASAEDRGKVLRVEVYDRRNGSEKVTDQGYLGGAECSMEDIISEPLLRRRMKLKDGRKGDAAGGVLTVAADVVRPVEGGGRVGLLVEMSSVTKGNGRVYYVVSRRGFCGEFAVLYRSEVLGKGEKKWKGFVREVGAVTLGMGERLIRLEVFEMVGGRGVRLGFVQFSLEKIEGMMENEGLVWWNCGGSGGGGVEVGRVVLIGKEGRPGGLRKYRLRITT